MTRKDGRDAKEAYRVRVGGVWYWVDPAVPAADLEAGDMVVLYPAGGEATFAILRGATGGERVAFASLEGAPFEIAARDIAALHLAAKDDVQG